ncbi:MAG: DNA cytosine methyltransferase, partial [Cephaloticoccus sp.]|nr:DNA cytosine methyltransferase [Cephaloticoccus sp.]
KNYLTRVAETHASTAICNHIARPHSARDLRDFLRLGEGENSAMAMKRGVEFEFPYDKTTFKDRYTRQHRNRPCSTIVAHLSKDGLMFIHPVQNRSLTPREAARVQSFPDWFVFPEAQTHAFRLIGNAVPPLVAEAVGRAIGNFIAQTHQTKPQRASSKIAAVTFRLPRDRAEATHWLTPFTDLSTDRKTLRTMATPQFLRAWHALLWLFPDLHPDNAIEHGEERHEDTASALGVEVFGRTRYTRSGWPVMLEGFGHEAWRRYHIGELTADQFYCTTAQLAGMRYRNAQLAAQKM